VSRPALLDDTVVAEWLTAHPTWRRNVAGHLERSIHVDRYATAVAVIATQIDLAEELDHQPLVTLGWLDVHFELWTHDRDGLTALDLAYAERFDGLVDKYYGDKIS
jgi:4a-hydroxytetrahydrobiopterin dehydratase